jgi:hypothetical protein
VWKKMLSAVVEFRQSHMAGMAVAASREKLIKKHTILQF